jgi:hypothetical protein
MYQSRNTAVYLKDQIIIVWYRYSDLVSQVLNCIVWFGMKNHEDGLECLIKVELLQMVLVLSKSLRGFHR